ncbi:hypothetical protein BB558_003024, partial [Smittium angustum]
IQSESITTFIKEEIVKNFGVPKVLVSDRGSRSTSEDCQILFNNLGITHNSNMKQHITARHRNKKSSRTNNRKNTSSYIKQNCSSTKDKQTRIVLKESILQDVADNQGNMNRIHVEKIKKYFSKLPSNRIRQFGLKRNNLPQRLRSTDGTSV